MTIDLAPNTYEELKAKADAIELSAVNFLAIDGTHAKGRNVHRVEFVFIDGEELTLPKSEIDRPEFARLRFRLRPTHNDG